MKEFKKGLENIHTMRSMVIRSMPMNSHEALMERARLDREKERLCNEKERLERRMGVIQNRLREIEKFEQCLELSVGAHRPSFGKKGGGSAANIKGKRRTCEMILKY